MRLQLERIHVDHELAVLAAERRRHRRAGHARDLVANLVLQVVVKLRLVQPLPLHGQQAHRQARSVHLQHHGGQRALRQAPQVGHGQIGNLRHIGIGVGARLEIDLDQAHAGQRARFHVVDAAGQREEALERVGDVRFDLLRRHAAVERGHQHHGNVDRRKHVHRHLNHAGDARARKRTGR